MRRCMMPLGWISVDRDTGCRQGKGALGLLALILSCWLIATLFPYFQGSSPTLGKVDRPPGTKIIEITGVLKTEGVYRVPENATLGDILRSAGLKTGRACLSPGEARKRPPNGARLHLSVDEASNPGLQIRDMAAGTRLLFDVPIDINKATEADLMLLNGVGRKTAESIVSFRTSHGPFRSIDDLKAVKGLKEKKLEKLQKNIEIAGGGRSGSK